MELRFGLGFSDMATVTPHVQLWLGVLLVAVPDRPGKGNQNLNIIISLLLNIPQEDILEAFQPFYQETMLQQEVNTDLIYQTQRELRGYGIYSDVDIEAFAKEYFKTGRQDARSMGRMTSILKPVADRYNQKTTDERYQFRRQIRSLIKWYSYISQVIRMFDKDLHKEFVFCSYLLGLLPAEAVDMVDLEGKLKLEYYKLQKTFSVLTSCWSIVSW